MYRVLEKKRKIRRKWINFLRSNDGKKVSSIRVLPIYYIRLETRAECTNAVHVCQGRHKSIYPRIGGIYMRIGSDTKPDEWWLAKGNDPSRGYLFSPPPPFPDSFSFCVSLSIACLVSTLLLIVFSRNFRYRYIDACQNLSPLRIWCINAYTRGKIFHKSIN